MDIDRALALYGDMDKMGRAGVSIRVEALVIKAGSGDWSAANELVIQAVQDEMAGLPLP